MTTRTRTHTRRKWSRNAPRHDHALPFEEGDFAKLDPEEIARSLQAAAQRGEPCKMDSFRSAMSMVTSYMNRAGSRLSRGERAQLERTKSALRRIFGRDNGQQASRR